jgi:hypothetical protein
MSEGERVVFERLPEGTPNDNPEHYTEEDGCFQPCPGSDQENVSGVYRGIPDPVPALEARIAELEGEIKTVRLRSARLWQLIDNFTPGVRRCQKCDSFAMQGYECDVCMKPPTPAAAKETP